MKAKPFRKVAKPSILSLTQDGFAPACKAEQHRREDLIKSTPLDAVINLF